MKKLLLVLLLPAVLFGANSNVQYNTSNHGVIKPPTSPGATFDLDFTGLNIGGLAVGGGGGGTPGGSDRQLQFNNAFTFGGVPYATYDGTTVTFRTGARFTLADPTDATKRVQLAITGAGLKTVTISDNQVTVTPFTAPANQFLTGVSAAGLPTSATVPFSGLTGTLSLGQTTMSTGKLIGRSTAGTGAMEEITVGTNLTLAGGVLDATGGGGTPGGSTAQFQYNNAGAFAGQNSLIFSGGNVLGRSNTFHIFDNSDNTAMFHFSTANIPTATDETVLVPNSANPVIVGGASAVASQWVRYIDNLGVQQRSQPTYADLGGSPTLAQQSIPINLERFVDPVNGSDISGTANLARPFLTLAGAALAAPAGTIIYTYPNITGYDQSTTPLVIPAGVTIAGAGADATLIKGAVTGVTRAVVEPSTGSAIYNVSIQNTSSTGIAFGVGSSSAAFTSAFLGGSKIISVAQGIYINKAGTTGLVVDSTSISTQNDCLFQNVSTATTELRNCYLIADGTATLTESKGLNVMNGIVRFNYGGITVGGATGTNVGAFGSGSGSTIELHGVRISNSLGGSTNYDVQQQSSATVGVDNVYRPDAGALVTNGTITQLSRYALRDNNLSDYPNIGAGTRGDIIFRNATGWGTLAAGIDGNVLTTHGSTADPTWTAVSGAGGIVDDTAFGVIWNGSTVSAPSQNSLYDILHQYDTDDDGKINVLDQTAGITVTNATGVIQTPLAAPAGVIVGDTDVQKLTNKRIKKRRLATAAPGPTPAINTDDYDVVHLTGLNADISFDSTTVTGAPDPSDVLHFDLTDDGTARAITFNTLKFMASPGQALPTTTVAGQRLDTVFTWDNVANRWRCLASSQAISVGGVGTVTSVGLTGANGITVTGATPITSSGAWALSLPITLAGTSGKTLTVNNTMTLSGTDGSTLNIGAGGTLGTNAFNSTTFLTASAISDSVWSSAMNGDTTTASSRNVVYDWGHTFDTNDNGKVDVLDIAAGIPKTDASGNVTLATGGTDYADLAFRTISVSGQSNVVADSASDTLTLAAGSNVTITTTAGTDTVTIAATGGGGSSATKQDVADADATIVAPVTVVNLTTTLTGARVLTLPAATDYNTLSPLVIQDPTAVTNGSNTISVARAGSDTINGGTGNVAVLTSAEVGGSVVLVSDGVSKWVTISKGGGSRTPSAFTGAFSTLTGIPTTLAGYGIVDAQPLNSNLTTIAGLTATTGNFIVSNASAWASRTPSQVRTTLGLVIGTDVQAFDSDLTTWAGITPGTGVGTALAVNVGTAGSFVTNGGALGTPSSGTLTNATGLPIAGLTASTSTALGVGSIELGHATDTTIARASAGRVTVEGVRVQLADPRVDDQNVPSSPYAPDSDTYDLVVLRAIGGALTINAPTGTPAQGRRLAMRFKDDGTARALTFQTGSSNQYRFSSDMAAPTTTVLSKTLYMLFIYNSTDSRWDNVAQMNNF